MSEMRITYSSGIVNRTKIVFWLTDTQICDILIKINALMGSFPSKFRYRECPVGVRACEMAGIVAPELTS